MTLESWNLESEAELLWDSAVLQEPTSPWVYVRLQPVSIHFLHFELMPCIEQQASVIQTQTRAK